MILIHRNRIFSTPLPSGVLSNVFKRLLNHFRGVSALGVEGSHETKGIICWASEFPLAGGERISFEMKGHQAGKNKVTTLKLAADKS